MRRVVASIFLLLSILGTFGCSKKEESSLASEYISAILNEEGNIVIEKKDISDTATFINYEIDGIVIQLIAVKATDGSIRVVLNTCSACTPAPNAYFIQIGEYFECQNCGTKIHVDELGKREVGCNPATVRVLVEDLDSITVDAASVIKYKENFANWNGPIA